MTRSNGANSRSSFFAYPFGILLVIILLQLFSHYNHAPLWLVVYSAAIAGYGFFTYKLLGKNTTFLIRIPLVLISVAIFFLYFKLNFSVDMAASFLMLACTLKFLELKNKNNVALFVYLMLYLSAISFLFTQSFTHAVLQFLVILACLYVLLILNSSQYPFKGSGSGSLIFKAIMIAGPIVIICFLFFPRIAPLWSIPIKTQTATTGMSDSMSPGDIAQLAKSSERAFRATFSRQAPANKELYWRGLVLDQFDGRAWRSSNSKHSFRNFKKIDIGQLYDHGDNYYEVMLEPNNQTWVYALEPSRVSSSNVVVKDAGQFQLKTDAIQSTRYKMTFKGVESRAEPPIATAKRLSEMKNEKPSSSYLQTPLESNIRTQKYIRELVVSFPNKLNLVKHLMQNFAERAYFYTLSPEVLGVDAVDEFLFDTKMGFCAHYASSLAYMLRLANIPARIIAGYQGGEYNQQGDYYIIHQYDAHAWVEAKLPNLGWVRLDPTAMVAPNRVLSGLNEAVGEQGGFLAGSPIASAVMKIRGLNWLRLRVDEFNYKWQKVVVNYSADDQQSLIKKLFKGFLPDTDSVLRVAVVVGGLFFLIISMVFCFIWYKRYSGRYSNVEKAYLLWLYFLTKLSGLKRAAGETPNAFLRRVKLSNYQRLAIITEKITAKLEQDQYQLK